jgi:WD40 repeat protein
MKVLGDAESRALGRYRLIAELGRGGMGRVLLGAGPDGRLVAVKQIRAHVAEEDGFTARFRREVAASRTVSGAYTAAVVDADVDGPTPWLASVYVPGPSLQDAVDVAGVLPEPYALRLAAGLASALIEIHRAGLVHRDLKPSNVLLTADGLRVIDFGIARAVDGESTRVTRSGWLIGSPEYMSPEQAEGHEVTAASDVFSLGSMLVMACTGSSPFTGPSTPRTLYNLVHTEPDLAALPDAVRRIAELCLAKDPADRPTPDELLTEIGAVTPSATPWPPDVHRLIEQQHAEVVALLDGDPAEPTVIAPPRVETTTMKLPEPDTVAVETRTVAPARRRRWLLPVLAVIVVAAAVAGLVVWWPWSGEERQVGLVALNDHRDLVTDLALSPDGDTLATVSYGGTLRLWNVADGQQTVADGQQTGEESRELLDVAFSPDGELVAVGGGGGESIPGTLRWYAVDTGRELGRIDFPVDSVSSVLFSPDGRLVTESAGLVQWWDLNTRQETARLRPDSPYQARWIAISPDGDMVATSGDDHSARLWDTATGRQVGGPMKNNDCRHTTTAVGFSPDGATLAAGDGCGTMTLWDVRNGNRVGGPFRVGNGTTPPDYSNAVSEVQYSPDGTVLAAVVDDVSIRLWKVSGWDAITPPDVDRPSGLVFTPDSRRIATAEYNDRVWLYRLPETP